MPISDTGLYVWMLGTSLQLSAWEVDPPGDPSLPHQLTGRALGALAQPL